MTRAPANIHEKKMRCILLAVKEKENKTNRYGGGGTMAEGLWGTHTHKE